MRALLMLWIVVLAGTVPVRALAVNVTFCAEYRTDYEDSDMGLNDPAAEGDYFATNSDKVARGALIRTIRNSDGLTSELYAEWTGTDAGCAGPFTLTDGEEYDVQILGEALVRGNTIKVMNNQDDRARWFSVALNDWTAPTTTTTEPIVTANTHDAWNVAAAAGHAMWRRGGGVSNKTFDFFTQYDQCDVGETDCDPCENGTGSCHRSGDIHLSTEGVVRRFIIVHEMGHALGWFAAGSQDAPTEYDDPDQGNCYTVLTRSHEMNSKEWQSAAIKEGFAHFYAAVAFNQTQELDCGFIYYKSQNYDLNQTVEAGDPHEFSCEAGPIFTTTGIDAKDYLGDMCTTGTLTDRATEMDWLRFWWDFLTEESATVSFDDCASIYASAVTGDYLLGDPWDPTPDASTPNGDRPYVHMELAAAFHLLASEWSNHIDNGVDR